MERFVYLMAIKTVIVDLMMGGAIIYLAWAVTRLSRRIEELEGEDEPLQ